MPLRNLFKRSGISDGGFRTASVVGANAIDVYEPLEVQLSEITDNGVFVAPAPTEKPGFWETRSNSSLGSSNHRSLMTDNETFTISRESFDSYRRSFDISARSPIPSFDSDSVSRRSVDSSLVLSLRDRRRSDWPEDRVEEEFEDVNINEEHQKPTSKRRSIFARFGSDYTVDASKPASSSLHHNLFSSRKRASSGQGAELSSMPQPVRDIPVVNVIAD